MANVTILDGNFISITLDGTTDWDFAGDVIPKRPEFAGGAMVKSIQIKPTATDDAIIIRNSKTANQTSPEVLNEIASSEYDIPRRKFGGDEGRLMYPSIHAGDVSDKAFKITIELG